MIIAENVSKVYQETTPKQFAIQDINIEIEKGKVCCIMGKSGSGKSTLLRQLGLIDTPSSGRILLDGDDTSKLSERERSYLRLTMLGYVFQEYALIPELTAIENVYLPQLQLIKGYRSEIKKRASEIMEMVGLSGLETRMVRQLSGGEQQRVAIARAMINQPKIIFADEPTANLDSVSTIVIMHVLMKLNKDLGTTIVFVSHDPDHHGYAQQITNLADGKIVKVQI